jgi:hypothetical protein
MKHKSIYAIVPAVALILLGAWWLGLFRQGKDPVVAELEHVRDQRLARRDEISEEERQASRTDFRRQMEQLTPEQRKAFFESSIPLFMKIVEQRLDEFFTLSPEQQRERMDERIDQLQGGNKRPFARNRQGPDPGQFDAMRKEWLDMTTPDQRARIERAMGMFNDRLQERGMAPMQAAELVFGINKISLLATTRMFEYKSF